VSLQYQETVDTALAAERAAPLPHVSRRTASRVALTGRLGLIWLPAYVFSFSEAHSLLAALAAASAITVVCYAGMKAAFIGFRLRRPALGQIGAAGLASLAGASAVSAVGLWVPWLISASTVLQLGISVFLLLVGWEALTARIAPQRRRLLVVGAADGGEELVEELRLEEDGRYELIGVVDDDRAGLLAGAPVLGGVADLPGIVGTHRPDLVVLAVGRNRLSAFESLLDTGSAGFEVLELAELHEQAFGRVPVRHLTAAWFMSCLHFYRRPYTRLAKRTFDLVVAAVGLLLSAPLYPLVWLLVKRTEGPVIFTQTRLGEGGRHFTIYKFRTMQADAEDGEPRWAGENDPRTIPGGRFLRRARIDELPQLWNVLRGEMSIVGPRPERPEFLERLQAAVPFWTGRHLVKPGITGWAQVRRGYAASVDETAEKLSYDLWYLRHRSLVTDLAICARTVSTLLLGTGSR
jgi:exopolysaccharide biosynthesis polyprenyl glycosylphosphotransferase